MLPPAIALCTFTITQPAISTQMCPYFDFRSFSLYTTTTPWLCKRGGFTALLRPELQQSVRGLRQTGRPQGLHQQLGRWEPPRLC